MEEIKNILKDKKLQKNVFIYFIIILIMIFIANWLIQSGQADRNKSQAENFNAYYSQLLKQCGQEKEIYDCCFKSVAYMAANNFKTANLGCNVDFKVNTFNCQGAYKWCEMIR